MRIKTVALILLSISLLGNVTADSTEPPYASSIKCTVDSTTKPCSNINSYSGTLTEIQATLEQYDPLQYVNISLADEYDHNYRILHKNYSSKSGDTVSWNVNEDLTDSGNYNITLLINETDGDTGYNQTQFSLPWGTLNPSITTPSSDISVAKGSTFTIKGKVTCVGGECSSETDGQGGGPEKIELWADPKPVDGKVKVVEHTGNVQGGDTITVDKKITSETDNSPTNNSQTSIIEELKEIINEVLQWN